MMKFNFLALSALTLATAPFAFAVNSTQKPATTMALSKAVPAPKIVVHLSNSETSNALHAAFMALGLATGLEKMGAHVTVMLDASAPNFVKQEWVGKSLSGGAMSQATPHVKARTLGDAFNDFVKAGGQIVLCPHCAKMCGVRAGAVIPAARIGAEGELAKLVFEADKVLDY